MFRRDLDGAVQPRVYRMVRRFESEHQKAAADRGAGIQECLGRIQQPAIRRVEPGLRDRPRRPDRDRPVVERNRGRDLPARAALQPHPRLGDDAQRPLGADEQPVRRRARTRSRQPARLADPRRGDHPQRFGQIIDVGIQGREVAARAGGQPAAEAGEGEGLREVPQRQIVRAQLLLDPRPQGPGLNPRGPADPVDVQDRAHHGDVHRDRRPVEARLDSADHRTAAAVGNHGNPVARTPVEHVDDILFSARPDDQVGYAVQVALEVTHHIAKRLAARVAGSIGGVGRAQRRQ